MKLDVGRRDMSAGCGRMTDINLTRLTTKGIEAMTTHDQVFQAADIAIRTIRDGNEDSTITAFATALGRASDARALSAKSVKSIANRLSWTRENISRQVYRLARIMLAELDDVKS
jgi:hypothetical protein